MTPWLRARVVLDRLVAAVLLVPIAPVIAALAWLVHRHDGGPGLVVVDRVGRGGRPLRMWKIRSMAVAAPDGTAGGPALTSAEDARITPIGARLRAYHLDELPQLLNVVRGEMSLLGPRPEAVDFVTDSALWTEVLRCPPGLAGPTQLLVGAWERERITAAPDGATYVDEVLPVKLAIDSWYLRRASPRVDALVAMTLLQRLTGRAAGPKLGELVGREVHQVRQIVD